MGLDMYLMKAKKRGNATPTDIIRVENYLDYLTYKEQGKADCTLEEWCGVKESDIDKDLVSDYQSDFVTHYPSWDIEHKYPISSIMKDIGYWRKVNAVHNWFVDNVQEGFDDCQYSVVSKEQLEELLDICERVIADHSLAPELLPTQSGFFFGSTDYDEYYFDDIQSTVEQLNYVLGDTDFDTEMVIYHASW